MKPGDVIPSNSVIIPADEAKHTADAARQTATNLRAERQTSRADFLDSVADLLDPQPPSLREQVAKAWCAAYYGEFSGSAKAPDDMQMQSADAVLAVVADWLAAQPLVGDSGYPALDAQRDHDVRLLRGQS